MFEFENINALYEIANCKTERVVSLEKWQDEEFEVATIYEYVLLKSDGNEKNILVIRSFDENSEDEDRIYDCRAIVLDTVDSVIDFNIVADNILKSSIVISKCPHTTADINVLTNLEFNTIDEYIELLDKVKYRENNKYTKLVDNEFVAYSDESNTELLKNIYYELYDEEVEVSEMEDAVLMYYQAAGFDFESIDDAIERFIKEKYNAYK